MALHARNLNSGTRIETYDDVTGNTLSVQDSSITTASGIASVSNGLTALVGGGQTGATVLPSRINRVTTVASAADSVKLPQAKAGMSVTVINAAAANAMAVFPFLGDIINALSANASISVAANKVIDFYCAVNGTWNSNLTA